MSILLLKMERQMCLGLFSLSFLTFIETSRILFVIPTPSISHQVVFRPLYIELAKRGHQVDVITTDPAFPKGETPKNLTEIDVHDVSYDLWRGEFLKTSTGHKSDIMRQMTSIFNLLGDCFDVQLEQPVIKEIFKRDKDYYDLLITEANVRAALIFSHFFNAPLTQMSSFFHTPGNYDTIGAPTHPLLYPLYYRQKLLNLTMWDKLQELYNYYLIKNEYYMREVIDNAILRKHFGPNIPTIAELRNNVHMLFLNIHPVFEGNHPVPPSVIYVWGIHRKPTKSLPNDLENYLNSSQNGVIYMSFGTNTSPSMLDQNKLKVFYRVFSQLPYNILFKWDKDEVPGLPKNVKVGKWFPQIDLLKHPKIKLFITQGGLQSTDEAITAGIPVLGVPMLGDQWYICELFLKHKIGLKLDFPTLDEESLKGAIEEIVGDSSYRQNIVKLRTLLHDQPEPALDRAIWWTEHVIRHKGAKHLRSPAANMSWREYLELDLVLMLLVVILVLITVCLVIGYYVLKCVLRFLIAAKTKRD